MIIVCMGDGLGNQMFQYAFYKAMQYYNPKVDIKMDIYNVYGEEMHNGFELDRVFGIRRNECQEQEASLLMDYCLTYNPKYKYKNVYFLLKLLFFRPKKTFYYQADATVYDEKLFQLNKVESKLFRGNWINEKYFKAIKQNLVNDFTFRCQLDEKNRKYLDNINNTNSVSIHVRRGDYLQTTFCRLELEYYKTAMKKIKEKVVNPQFFIFSDDREYIIQNFSFLDNYVMIEGNDRENSHIDMYLMTCCKHNIIANSSFSFWGAYLNKHQEKLVIAPIKASPYLLNPFACEEWIKIAEGVSAERKMSFRMKFIAHKYVSK